MTKQDIQNQLTQAMRDKDALRVSVLRNILAACTNELVATNRTPQDSLTDEEVQRVIARLAKQRRESIEQFTTGNRADLAEKEMAELAILETFLPEPMSEAELRTIVNTSKAELGITDKSGMGQLMGAVMKKVAGQADGGAVKKIVEEMLS